MYSMNVDADKTFCQITLLFVNLPFWRVEFKCPFTISAIFFSLEEGYNQNHLLLHLTYTRVYLYSVHPKNAGGFSVLVLAQVLGELIRGS